MPRRASLPLALVLAVVTAVALLHAGAALTVEQADTAAQGDRAIGCARAVYAAENDVLRTGDPTALDALVSPAFVEHQLRAGEAPDRTGFEHDLVALHATFPDVRLTVEDLLADGDRVTARVVFHGTPRAAFVDMPLVTMAATWQEIDVLRLAGGKVVEHWGSPDPAGRLQPLLAAPLDRLPPAPTAVALDRLTFPPGADLAEPPLPWPLLMVAESETLTVRGSEGTRLTRAALGDDAGEAAVTTPTGDVALRPGDQVVFPTGTFFGLRNDGPTPASALAVALLPPPESERFARTMLTRNDDPTPEGVLGLALFPPSGDAPTVLPSGVTAQPIAGGVVSAWSDGLATLAVGRAVLPPGTGFQRHHVAGVELFAVEAGRLAPAVSGGMAQVGADVPVQGITGETTLTTGNSVLVGRGTAAARNDGDAPLVLLALTINPAMTGAAPPTG